MGIRLVVEVLDGYHGPDHRKLWLIAFAEQANDFTRTGWPTRQLLAQRIDRSPSRVSHIADELVAEGVIKRDGGGNRSGPARFILLPVTGGKGASSAHSFNGEKGAPSTHPSDDVKSADSTHPSVMGAPSTHPSGPMGAASAHPKPQVKGAEPPRKGADPTPPPAQTGPLPLTTTFPSENLTAAADAPTAQTPPTAQTILSNFIDWVRDNDGDLTRRTIGQIAKTIGDLLEQGMDARYIRHGLADWHRSGQNPATLDSFVNAARNARSRGPRDNGRPAPPSITDRVRGWQDTGRALRDAQERGLANDDT